MNRTEKFRESFGITIAIIVVIALIAVVVIPEVVTCFKEMITKLPGA